MKPAIHLIILLASGTLLQGQNQDPFQVVTPAPPEKAGDFFFVNGGPLRDAIDQLSVQLQEKKQELPNIIITPEAQQALVPEMRLYRVSPADAIQLIATAAGFEMEPIESVDLDRKNEREFIGYRIFDPRDDLAKRGGGIPAPPAPAVMPNVPSAPATTPLPTPSISLPTPAEAFNQLGGPFLVGPGGLPQPFDVMIAPPGIKGGGAGGVGIATPQATILKVYPLGVTQTSAKEFEALLRDMLRQAELDTLQDKTRLMFHEDSRILMANAPEQVHQIVSQLLDALARNQQADLLQRIPAPIVVP